MRCSVFVCFFQEGIDSFEKRHSFSVGLNNLYRASTIFSRVAQSNAVVSECKLNLLRWLVPNTSCALFWHNICNLHQVKVGFEIRAREKANIFHFGVCSFLYVGTCPKARAQKSRGDLHSWEHIRNALLSKYTKYEHYKN